jgi:hypothetical protein
MEPWYLLIRLECVLKTLNDVSDTTYWPYIWLEGPRKPTLKLSQSLTPSRAVPQLRRRRPGFDPRSGHMGFVVDEVALGQVFSEYFGFPCQFSFHRLLHTHHLSSGAGTIRQILANVASRLNLTPPQEIKKKTLPRFEPDTSPNIYSFIATPTCLPTVKGYINNSKETPLASNSNTSWLCARWMKLIETFETQPLWVIHHYCSSDLRKHWGGGGGARVYFSLQPGF